MQKKIIKTTNGIRGIMDIDLPVAHHQIALRAITPIRFHGYSGSAWRGLFGHALKRSACVTHEHDCTRCVLYRSCVYSYIFETPPPADTHFMRRYSAAPHPFILRPDLDLRTLDIGETTILDLTLIGKASQYLPYIVHAFDQAGRYGIGPAKGEYEIVGIEQETIPGSGVFHETYTNGSLAPLPAAIPEIPPLPDSVTLIIQSPVRLKYEERLLSPDRFAFAAIISNLLRRLSMLSYFHNDKEQNLDFKALVATAKQVRPTATDIKWYNWARYSSRQKTKIKMDGITGTVMLDGNDIKPFWPLLWLGQWLHVGKATSMGMGHYKIEVNDHVVTSPKAA
jgi:CRISPR-associated endoribonuclease Cas6